MRSNILRCCRSTVSRDVRAITRDHPVRDLCDAYPPNLENQISPNFVQNSPNLEGTARETVDPQQRNILLRMIRNVVLANRTLTPIVAVIFLWAGLDACLQRHFRLFTNSQGKLLDLKGGVWMQKESEISECNCGVDKQP